MPSFVTANFFRELGATARLGRMHDPVRDEASNAEPVVVLVLGQQFWNRRLGSDPLIVGKTIRLNNKPATVVGVASSGCTGHGLDTPDLWAPISQEPTSSKAAASRNSPKVESAF
jgi:hypothetical protein